VAGQQALSTLHYESYWRGGFSGGKEKHLTLDGTWTPYDHRNYTSPWRWLSAQLSEIAELKKELDMAKKAPKMPGKGGGGKKPCVA
jgi:hypothetical protein